MPPTEVVGAYTSTERENSGEPLWWVLLITGSLWSIFGLVVFRFDYTTVSAMSILLGTVCLAAALFEAVAAASTHGGWRITHVVLAILFAAIGTVAYIHPENTFKALASLFAFYLFFRGIFDIIVALFARPAELWWVGLISGVLLVLLAFWAAGNFGHKAFLLVVWVGASALIHGIQEIVTAFRIRPSGPRPAAA